MGGAGIRRDLSCRLTDDLGRPHEGEEQHPVRIQLQVLAVGFTQLPVRQWVLSLPKRLRYLLRNDLGLRSRWYWRFLLHVVEQILRERAHGAVPKARLGAVSLVHRFRSALNKHFHCCVIDGVFQLQYGDEVAVQFREAMLTDADVQWVQAHVRQPVICWFVRQDYIDKDDAKDMAKWRSGGDFCSSRSKDSPPPLGAGAKTSLSADFSVDASVRIEADDRAGLERLVAAPR